MGIQLVTGLGTADHITSADAGSMHAGIVGEGRYVFDRGNKFAYEVISNNLIKIKDGDLLNQGRHMRIPVNDYEECTIENGLQSVKRHDLIVARYSKNTETEIETPTMVVIKGVSGDTPADPSYNVGNILNGDTLDDFPLYRVRLNGLVIEGVDTLFNVNKNLDTVRQTVENLIPFSTYSELNNNTSLGKTADATHVKTFKDDLWKKEGKNLIRYGQQPTGNSYDGYQAYGDYVFLNSNYSITIKSAFVSFPLRDGTMEIASAFSLKKGSYTLTGCMIGATTERLLCYKNNTIIAADSGSGADFVLTEDSTVSVCVQMRIDHYYSTDCVFYPMIRYSYIEDSSFEAPREYTNQSVLADKFSQNLPYSVGMFTIKNDILYKCNTASAIGNVWTPSHWTQTSIGAELGYFINLCKYKDIASQISSPSHCTVRYAYVENGQACILIDVPAGYAGVATFSLNTAYCPRGAVNGVAAYTNNVNDAGKIGSATIGDNGSAGIRIDSALAGSEQVYFTYPIKSV